MHVSRQVVCHSVHNCRLHLIFLDQWHSSFSGSQKQCNARHADLSAILPLQDVQMYSTMCSRRTISSVLCISAEDNCLLLPSQADFVAFPHVHFFNANAIVDECSLRGEIAGRSTSSRIVPKAPSSFVPQMSQQQRAIDLLLSYHTDLIATSSHHHKEIMTRASTCDNGAAA